MTTNNTEKPFVRLARAWSLLVIGTITALGLSGCIDSDAVRKDAQDVTEKIQQLHGVNDTRTTMLGAFHSGGGISIEFDSALPDTDFLKSYRAAIALANSKEHISVTDVTWGNIEFEPYHVGYDPAPLTVMKRIPGFTGATFTGFNHVYFDTPLAAVKALKTIHDQNLLGEQDTSRTTVTSKTEGQPSVDLILSEPELAAIVPEFLTLPGLDDVQTRYKQGMAVSLLPGTDPAAAQALAAAKSGPPPRTIHVHVMTTTPEITPSTAKPPA